MEAGHALLAMKKDTEEECRWCSPKTWKHYYSIRIGEVHCVKKVEEVAERVADAVCESQSTTK